MGQREEGLVKGIEELPEDYLAKQMVEIR